MAKTVIVCGKLFDGLSDTIAGPTEILISKTMAFPRCRTRSDVQAERMSSASATGPCPPA
jgi:hypothetical protein